MIPTKPLKLNQYLLFIPARHLVFPFVFFFNIELQKLTNLLDILNCFLIETPKVSVILLITFLLNRPKLSQYLGSR